MASSTIDRGYMLDVGDRVHDEVTSPVSVTFSGRNHKHEGTVITNAYYIEISAGRNSRWTSGFDVVECSSTALRFDETDGSFQLYIYAPHIGRFLGAWVNNVDFRLLILKSSDYTVLKRVADWLPKNGEPSIRPEKCEKCQQPVFPA